jgi:hypothetical protein
MMAVTPGTCVMKVWFLTPFTAAGWRCGAGPHSEELTTHNTATPQHAAQTYWHPCLIMHNTTDGEPRLLLSLPLASTDSLSQPLPLPPRHAQLLPTVIKHALQTDEKIRQKAPSKAVVAMLLMD